MRGKLGRWVLGLCYIVTVAIIWIAASFVVQSVVEGGVSPFLITYICNSLLVIYIPLVELGRFLKDTRAGLFFWRPPKAEPLPEPESEEAILLGRNKGSVTLVEGIECDPVREVDRSGRWTRVRVAKISLLICPFWFLAQLTFNLSLKYTSVTSNTILSSASSLFTFLVSLAVLSEKFTWVKLASVLLCMAGTIIVSLGDTETGLTAIASNPLLGDVLALVSAGFYAVYITLIRLKLPDDDDEKSGRVSMSQFLGFLGFFNMLIFLPVALILNFTKLEPFSTLTWKQFGLIVGKGLLDNVLSDYLWAKAVVLTNPTVATAGLTIQVPFAAIVDFFSGNAPGLMDYVGAVAVMIGFAGINLPSDASKEPTPALEDARKRTENEHTSNSLYE